MAKLYCEDCVWITSVYDDKGREHFECDNHSEFGEIHDEDSCPDAITREEYLKGE